MPSADSAGLIHASTHYRAYAGYRMHSRLAFGQRTRCARTRALVAHRSPVQHPASRCGRFPHTGLATPGVRALRQSGMSCELAIRGNWRPDEAGSCPSPGTEFMETGGAMTPFLAKVWRSRRFAFLGLSAMLLTMLPALLLVQTELQTIHSAEREVAGLKPAGDTLRLVQLSQRHRALSNLVLAGQSSQLEAWHTTRSELIQATADVVISVAQLRDEHLSVQASALAEQSRALADSVSRMSISREDSLQQHSALVNRALALVDDIANTTGISLHRQTAGHFLQSAVLQFLPAATEALGQLRVHGSLILADRKTTAVERNNLANLVGVLQATLQHASKALVLAQAAEPRLASKLATGVDAAFSASASITQLVDQELLRTSTPIYPSDQYFAIVTRAIDTQFALIGTAFQALEEELEYSVRRSRTKLAGIAAGLAVLFALMTGAALLMFRSEAARSISDARFSAILDAAPDAVLVTDQRGQVIAANLAAERIFGYSHAELIGLAGDRLVAMNPEEAKKQLKTVFSHPRLAVTRTHQFDAQRKDNSIFPAETARSAQITEEDAYMVSIVRDVSERRSLELQLAQSQKMEAIGQLTGGIAHDFNNLLGVIVGNLDLLERQLADKPEGLRRVNTAQRAALRGADLTRRLLVFSRRQHLEPVSIHLADAITNLTEMASRILGPEISIRAELDPALPPVYADASALESTLLNLAINSRDAMPDGGTLLFTATPVTIDTGYPAVQNGELKAGHYVILRVADTGRGIPRELLDRVFEPFFTIKERGKGTGLGLSMVYGFTKQSGGSVKIYSEENIGTTVSLMLPVAERLGAQASQAATASTHTAAEGAVALVVDDEADLLEIASTYLQELGYQVFQAPNAVSALTLLEQIPHLDLLLTDVIMPGDLNGVRLAARVKALRPSVHVVFTSGFPSQALAERSGTRVDGPLLSKPYVRGEFVAILERVFGERANEPTDLSR
ncbi:MAG: hypothetical protein CGU29_08175 [Candidatus Dactylopiibacterium carminicum]|uniref:histidine kinase n=2 Tax=Candidatus Dactylopiibacterium carminicum TaxID=857335 RepID=A0A272ET69_9RHOO|nr:hypothetical protein BGI27_08525 [Candidatus Dactylopiibacterium carminicum]PAS93302.1 MAG: hypothetical protein CGU29_08175 [Candidatus Dactylopiibacterium carminicum]